MHGDTVITELVHDRGGDLTAFAYLLTGDVPGAQDLVQDALVKVFGRIRTGFTPQTAEAYVRRTIVTLYVDAFRRRRRWMSVRHLLAPDDVPPTDVEGRVDLRTALAALSPQERTTVVLRYYEDLPLAEVADRMGLAVGTVKRYASNALHKLETQLGPVAAPVGATVDVLPAQPPSASARRS